MEYDAFFNGGSITTTPSHMFYISTRISTVNKDNTMSDDANEQVPADEGTLDRYINIRVDRPVVGHSQMGGYVIDMDDIADDWPGYHTMIMEKYAELLDSQDLLLDGTLAQKISEYIMWGMVNEIEAGGDDPHDFDDYLCWISECWEGFGDEHACAVMEAENDQQFQAYHVNLNDNMPICTMSKKWGKDYKQWSDDCKPATTFSSDPDIQTLVGMMTATMNMQDYLRARPALTNIAQRLGTLN